MAPYMCSIFRLRDWPGAEPKNIPSSPKIYTPFPTRPHRIKKPLHATDPNKFSNFLLPATVICEYNFAEMINELDDNSIRKFIFRFQILFPDCEFVIFILVQIFFLRG